MHHTIWFLVTGVFLVGWLLIPAILLHYRFTSVVHRYKEVLDAFLWRGVLEDKDIQDKDIRRPLKDIHKDIDLIPAWHYMKALRPTEAAGMRKEDVSCAHLIGPIEEQYRNLHGLWRYAFPLILVALFAGVDLVACHSWVIDQIAMLQKAAANHEITHVTSVGSETHSLFPFFFPGIPTSVAAALAGAYVWSLYEIINRRNTRDLTSDELYPIAFRLATAVPIGLAFAELLGNDARYSAVAFVATAFPFRDVSRLLRQMVVKNDLRNPVSSDARRLRGYLAETLQGFSPDTVVRLEELNIATVLDMAYADPVYLMFKTGTPIRQVITWLDESLLSTYVGPRTADFAKLGLPCSINVVHILRNYKPEDQGRIDLLNALAESLDMKKPVLEDLLKRVEMDPQVCFIFSVWEAGKVPQGPES